MDQFDQSLKVFLNNAGWLAPVFFILLHVFRQFFFLPVIVVCIAGGFLFGFVEGTLLSFIGLSLMSLISYKLVNRFPTFKRKITRLKTRVFQDHTISLPQVMVLRIMPFIHFHLLSLYLMEMTNSFKEYAYYSILGAILPAVVYTAFGEVITSFPWYASVIFALIMIFIYILVTKWNKSRIKTV